MNFAEQELNRRGVPDPLINNRGSRVENTDRGFAIFSFCYKDVAGDDNDFNSKCARHLCPSRKAKNSSGKIMMWAWAARVMSLKNKIL